MLLLIGVIFHIAYIFSIFDIYFTSPLVHGMGQHRLSMEPPARRLVLFVADGLRADRLYEPMPSGEDTNGYEAMASDGVRTRAPFLHDVVTRRGSWGVSHTRVPTESRPGHVAIIAGFYEDVSAVTKGWKMNPVDFDSVFNQTKHTWSFGSPDILPMFAHGASDPDRVKTYMYSEDEENFSKEASGLDTWVFERFHELFQQAKVDERVREQLASDRIVFFLHLLGLDTNGHAFRPHSKEYINNIRLVDAGIRQAEKLIDEYYNHDGKTAYVFTSDHGMGNRGAHGDGDPDNTRTPLIAWGAGVRGPTLESHGHDDFSASWGLNKLDRKDVAQADIAPLMASLLGINYPANNVGVLPLGYLQATPEFVARSALTNALQVLEQFRVKEESKRRTEFAFKPYQPMDNMNVQRTLEEINTFIAAGRFAEAENQSMRLIEQCLQGLRYYQTYDWFFLRSIISIGYIGWIAYSLLFIVQTYVLDGQTHHLTSNTIDLVALVFGAVLFTIFFIQRSPAMYYLYAVFPVYFWRETLQKRHVFSAIFAEHATLSRSGQAAGLMLLLVGALELLVSYAYRVFFERRVLSACLLAVALWPFTAPVSFQKHNRGLIGGWMVACASTAIFPALPVEKGDDITLVVAGGIATLVAGALYLVYFGTTMRSAYSKDAVSFKLNLLQLALIVVSIITTADSVHKLELRKGLPELNQIIGWATLALSLGTPLMASAGAQHYLHRLLTIFLAFAPTFVLLSISYEMLFYVAFSALLFCWMLLERRIYAF
ncbi:Phosphatidylinositolglycan class N-domain-containing protein, partial [Thamnocephalis sphaerospora]